jgi:hypothetical protein
MDAWKSHDKYPSVQCGMCEKDTLVATKVRKRRRKYVLLFCEYCGAITLDGPGCYSVEFYRGDYEPSLAYMDKGKVYLIEKNWDVIPEDEC